MSEKKIKVLALQSPQIIINALAVDFERRTGFGITQLLRPETCLFTSNRSWTLAERSMRPSSFRQCSIN
jgi:hypothetical protein